MAIKKLAFIDIETTGLDITKHEILEIGCIVVEQTEVAGKISLTELYELDIKVQPQHIERADPEALRINRYDATQWMFAYTPEQALQMLIEKTEGASMVAHNVSFDAMFLEKAFRENGKESKMHYHKLDTLSLAYVKLLQEPETRLSLGFLCKRFGIVNKRAHTALADARATMEIYKKLMNM